jgi:hypothetical protein
MCAEAKASSWNKRLRSEARPAKWVPREDFKVIANMSGALTGGYRMFVSVAPKYRNCREGELLALKAKIAKALGVAPGVIVICKPE